MTNKACPERALLIEFVDEALSREANEAVERHLLDCPRCGQEVAQLRQLCRDLAAPLDGELDVPAHVQSVLGHLDEAPKRAQSGRKVALMAAAASLAAAAALTLHFRHDQPELAEFQARGSSASSLSREVGVEPLAYEPTLRRLGERAHVGTNTPLGASFRNLGSEPVRLLLFAVDAGGSVHWLSPPYTRADSDPEATLLAASQVEQPLPTTLLMEGARPGALRVVSVVSRDVLHVSDVERLAPADLTLTALQRRFSNAVVRQVTLELDAGDVQ
ncbi:MAG: zf-HC2 domain-containing protein [Polyangiaceae bacterium]